MSVPHTKGGAIVWTCVKDHIIDEKENHKEIGLHGFDYKLFEEEEGGGNREGIDGYPYLKDLIQLWPGYWVRQMEKMNEAVCMKNRFTSNQVGKQSVRPFKRQEFWKCIGCILLKVNYGEKGRKIWSEVPKFSGKYENPKLQRYVRVTTDLYKVCCAHYFPFYIYACH